MNKQNNKKPERIIVRTNFLIHNEDCFLNMIKFLKKDKDDLKYFLFDHFEYNLETNEKDIEK